MMFKIQNLSEIILIIIVLSLAAFLRFYMLDQYMNFLGDEGRDGLVVKRILVDKDYPLLGPPTSVGNMYLGPLYYYMMSVPMAIFWLDPVAATGMVAFIGVLTVFLIYYLAKEWVGIKSALLAAFAYAISPVTIVYSKSSWNPNPAPFFSLLSIISLGLVHKTRDFRWLILTGAALAFALQMHYLAAIMVPIIFLLYLTEIFRKGQKKWVFLGTLGGTITFLFLMSPLVIFDLKYNFLNSRSLLELIQGKDSALGFNILDNLSKIIPTYFSNLIGRYLAGQNFLVTSVLSVLVLIPIGKLIYQLKFEKKFNWLILASLLWLIIGLVGLSYYKDEVYDHYLGFMNPAPYLLLGASILVIPKRLTLFAALGLSFLIAASNLPKNPLLSPPNRQLFRTQEIAKYVIAKSAERPFNFALIAERNYDSAYQFYLYKYGHTPWMLPDQVADQLFVVCEDKICNPTTHSKFEISAFGMSKIAEEDEVLGVRVFRLIQNPKGKP